MTDKDKPKFATVLIGIGEVYGETVSKMRLELYFSALEDLSLADVIVAAGTHVGTSKWFPKPSELRELVHGSVEDQAELAWTHVQREVRRVGWTGTPTWPDESTKRAAMQLFGGWRALCENLPASGPELLGHAKQFKASFTACARRDQALLTALPPDRDDARERLIDLKGQLEARGLPTKGL